MLVLLVLCSCHNAEHNPATTQQTGPGASTPQNNNAQTGKDPTTLTISSSAFPAGGMIPSQYTCDGENISPPLQWSGLPANTRTVALVVDDPDAPGRTWVHWVVYDLPANTTQIAENVKPQAKLPTGGTQGTNDFKKIGYGGPCPPVGTHRYFFRLYALDIESSLGPGTTKDDLMKAIEGHVVAQGEFLGKYKR